MTVKSIQTLSMCFLSVILIDSVSKMGKNFTNANIA